MGTRFDMMGVKNTIWGKALAVFISIVMALSAFATTSIAFAAGDTTSITFTVSRPTGAFYSSSGNKGGTKYTEYFYNVPKNSNANYKAYYVWDSSCNGWQLYISVTGAVNATRATSAYVFDQDMSNQEKTKSVYTGPSNNSITVQITYTGGNNLNTVTKLQVPIKYRIQGTATDKATDTYKPTKYGTAIVAPNQSKVPEGYELVSTSGVSVTTGKDSSTPNPIIFYIKAKPVEQVTVTWKDGYSTKPLKTEKIKKGDTVPQDDYPAKPTREGYSFDKWGDPETDSDGNITITAQWVENASYYICREYWLNGTKLATETGAAQTGKVGDVLVGKDLEEANPGWRTRIVEGNTKEFGYVGSFEGTLKVKNSETGEMEHAVTGTKADTVTLTGNPITDTIVIKYELNETPKCPHNNVDYTDNGNGTHDGECSDCGETTTTGENHADDDDNGKCDKCDACMHDHDDDGYCTEPDCDHDPDVCCPKPAPPAPAPYEVRWEFVDKNQGPYTSDADLIWISPYGETVNDGNERTFQYVFNGGLANAYPNNYTVNGITYKWTGTYDPDTKKVDENGWDEGVWNDDHTVKTYRAQYEMVPVTYTVTYTDGVDNEVVFEDKFYTANKDADTPKFDTDENGNEIKPTRDGYEFVAWSPEVASTVTENVTYTAQWKKAITWVEIPVKLHLNFQGLEDLSSIRNDLKLDYVFTNPNVPGWSVKGTLNFADAKSEGKNGPYDRYGWDLGTLKLPKCYVDNATKEVLHDKCLLKVTETNGAVDGYWFGFNHERGESYDIAVNSQGEQFATIIDELQYAADESLDFSQDYFNHYLLPYSVNHFFYDKLNSEGNLDNKYYQPDKSFAFSTQAHLYWMNPVLTGSQACPLTKTPYTDYYGVGKYMLVSQPDDFTVTTKKNRFDYYYVRTITVTWLDGYTGAQVGDQRIIANGSDYSNLYPQDPTRDSYEFNGWSDPEYDDEGNITITAQWHKHDFKKKLDDDGETVWVDGKAPDCIKDGTAIYVCSCGITEERVETGSALGHTFKGAEWKDNCTSNEDSDCSGHTMTCTRCKGELKDGNETQAAVHTFGKWITDKDATLTEEGAEHRVCTDCGHIQRATIPTLDKVTVEVRFVDENNKTIGEGFVEELVKNADYNVTELVKNIPDGYEPNGNPFGDDLTGKADTDKVVKVPVKKVVQEQPVTPAPVPGTDDPTDNPAPENRPNTNPAPVNPTAPVVTPAVVTPPADAPATPAPADEAAIDDNAAPLAAAPEEGTIADDDNALAGFDDPYCWTHWLMILGALVTIVYCACVIARRRSFIKKFDDFEDDVIGGKRSASAYNEAAYGAYQTM